MNEHSRLASPDVQTPLSGHRLALQSLCSCRTEASWRLSLHTQEPWIFIPKHPGANRQYKHHKCLIKYPQSPETQGEAPMPLWWGTDLFPPPVPDCSHLPEKGVTYLREDASPGPPLRGQKDISPSE